MQSFLRNFGNLIDFFILFHQESRTLKVDETSEAFVNIQPYGRDLDKLLEYLLSKHVTTNCLKYPMRCKLFKFRHAIDFISSECGYQSLFDSLAAKLHFGAINNKIIATKYIETILNNWYTDWRMLISVYHGGSCKFLEAVKNGVEKIRKGMVNSPLGN